MSSNTGSAATRPSSLSQMFLSRQLVNVGNNVDRNTWGAGRSCEGHHLGVRATSYTPKRLSLWKADSGDALGEGKRKLGARDELCADHRKSVYAGNGTGGDDTPGTASFSVGQSPAAMTGEEEGLGVEVPDRGERP